MRSQAMKAPSIFIASGDIASSRGEAGTRLRTWWMAIVLSTFYILSYVDRTIAAHLVDPVKKSFTLTDFEISLILGPAFGFTYALSSLPAGWLADRFDRRLVVLGGALFWSLMTMACGFATTAIALVATRMLVAIGEATLAPSAASMIADGFPPRQLGTALAIYQSGSKIGSSLAYFVAAGTIVAATAISMPGALGYGFLPWQIVFMLVGFPGIFLAFLPLTFPKVERRTRPAGGPSDRQEVFAFLKQHRRIFAPLMCGLILIAIPGGALSAWLPTFMSRTYGWTAAQYGPRLGLTTAVAAISLVPSGLLVDWFFRRGVRDAALRILTWLLMIATPLASIVFFLGSTTFVIGMALLQFVVLSYPFYVLAVIQAISPSTLRGRMTGLLLAIVPLFSQGAGPMLIGGLTDFAFHDPNKIGAALAIVSTLCLGGGFVLLRVTLARVGPLLPSSPREVG